MALYGPVESRSLSARIVYGVMYVILITGSITMVYPFLLMLGASVTTDLDFDDWAVVPAYLTDDAALWRKWMDDRYGDDFALARRIHDFKAPSFRFLEVSDIEKRFRTLDTPLAPLKGEIQKRVDDWLECVKTLPEEFTIAFYRDLKLTRPTVRRFSQWLYARYHGDIAAFNRTFDTAYTRFEEVAPFELTLAHKTRPDRSPLRREYLALRKTLPPEDLEPALALDGFLIYAERHIGSIETLNEMLGTHYASWRDVVFPVERPEPGPWCELWDTYVARRLPLVMLRVEGDFDETFRQFLAAQHHNYDKRVADYNAAHGTSLPLLAYVKYPSRMPEDDLNFADWVAFTDTKVPPEAKRLVTCEGLWRDWLKAHYASLENLNAAHGTAWHAWADIMPPRAETDLCTFLRHKNAIRGEFALRNYKLVLNYMLFHGRAALNTLILVILVVFGQLTVQPLAAYGLSRFRLRYSHKVLLFLLATMAFPAEVAMIPNFLLIKELGLLNTYWALVLPGLASGMGIFLLKGYFDSLPKELYEAAMIDGAGELRMFLQITVPLSMPILAVIALGSFAGAYGGFMWAFLICQKPEMWTLMVFLWQLGRDSYQSVWMASLVLAAIPTLLVFIFCQKIILRGIIVPTMK